MNHFLLMQFNFRSGTVAPPCKRRRYLRHGAAGLVIAALAACSNPPYPRGSLEALYPNPPVPQLQRVQVGARSVQVAVIPGTPGAAPLVFVHGSPGDWKAWARYLDTPELDGFGARYAIDRPGYGGSGAGEVITDLHAQAEIISKVIATLAPGQPVIVVGHSLGGPLVGWLALEHPQQICGGVMVAGSMAPELEAPRWYNRLAETWLAHWLAPEEMLWSNREILALQGELQKLDAAWPRLQRPLVAVQGGKDELVNPLTVDYLEQRAPKQWLQVVRVPDQGHFILWKQPQLVVDAIKSLGCGPAAASH